MSAMLVVGGGEAAPSVADDLEAAGISVIDGSNSTNFIQDLLTEAPDLVILYQDIPDAGLFETAERVGQLAPRPIILFTRDPDAENIARAMQIGIHAYIIDGYSQNRLRSVIHLAQARFRRDRLIREELAQANQRFEERKLVDRAKGILMGARQLREEEAYRALRRVSMHTKQRIGQVSQRVIDSARYAEAVNRAGQLRMLSQRLVKLYALTCAEVRLAETKGMLADSIALVDDTLAILVRSLSQPTFGDLIEAVAVHWKTLKPILERPAQTSALEDVDRIAEDVLLRSEQLTANLEIGGYANSLRVINVAGRQRMLSQRLPKATLLALLLTGKPAKAARAVGKTVTSELVDGMAYLLNLPLSNPEISRELEAASSLWQELQTALATPSVALEQVADLSERLLERFDRLTTQYEHAMQSFVSSWTSDPAA